MAAAWAKLDRARHHARALQQMLSPLVHGGGYRFVGEPDDHPTKLIYRGVGLPTVGPEVSATFGDFLNNTRSALDHLAWRLAPVRERERHPRRIQFPICESDTDDRGRPRPARISGVTDPAVIDAVEAVQPYAEPPGPDRAAHPLRLLNALCNIDKHRSLLIAVVAMEPRGIWWGSDADDAPVVRLQVWPGPLTDGDPAIRFDFGDREPSPDFDPHLEIQVRVREQLPEWHGEDVLTVARSIYDYVEFAVLAEQFAPILGAPVRHGIDMLAP